MLSMAGRGHQSAPQRQCKCLREKNSTSWTRAKSISFGGQLKPRLKAEIFCACLNPSNDMPGTRLLLLCRGICFHGRSHCSYT
jgi:hypothetical protein